MTVAHQKNTYFLLTWQKNKYTFESFNWTAIVVWAVIIFLLDNLRERGSVPLTSKVLHVLKILVAYWLKIADIGYSHFRLKGKYLSIYFSSVLLLAVSLYSCKDFIVCVYLVVEVFCHLDIYGLCVYLYMYVYTYNWML